LDTAITFVIVTFFLSIYQMGAQLFEG
jgi:hypothetical protein